jgi:hypothetical protein
VVEVEVDLPEVVQVVLELPLSDTLDLNAELAEQ